MTLTLDVKVKVTRPTRGLPNNKKIIGLSFSVTEILAFEISVGYSIRDYTLAETYPVRKRIIDLSHIVTEMYVLEAYTYYTGLIL